jgi:hypothetical protein
MPVLINLYELSYYLNYIIILIYTHANILHNKYVKKNDIVLYTVNCNKYDKIHDLTIVYYLFNIQIHTYRNNKKNYKRHIIYKDSIKLSDVTFIKEIPINKKKIQVILHLLFLDNLSNQNKLIVYNCGIIVHENFFISHIYNFLSYRRDYNKRLDY